MTSALSLLAGDVLGSVAGELGNRLAETAKGKLHFLDFDKLLQKINSEKLTLKDLNLSTQDKAEILDIINMAREEGIKNFEVEVAGKTYLLNSDSLEVTPILN